MGITDLEELLKATMGLSAASIGPAAIERAVQERLSACGLEDLELYVDRVRSSTSELQALIEAVVVAETWFFRDRHAFSALTRMVREEWLPSHPAGALLLLSLPCSTGEEPYSMAMALIDAGTPVARFRIDAVDISSRSLAFAARAVYGRNSFRGQDLGFRDRHFAPTPQGYRVNDAVRQQVRFQQGNLFATDLLPGSGIYDVIFCRNVLIYFDRPTQDRALRVLNRLLRPGGVLFVAPAETALPGSHQLVSTREPMAFAFKKVAGSAPVRAVPTLRPMLPPVKPLASLPVGREAPRAPVPLSEPAVPGESASQIGPPQVVDELAIATRLADQGDFVGAADRCEVHIRQHGPSATAFYLLGLVRDAAGKLDDAVAYYRKALYLDPEHYDTQIHLALLLEKRGERATAEILRNRARRLEQRHKVRHG